MSHSGSSQRSEVPHEVAAFDDKKSVEKIVALASATGYQSKTKSKRHEDPELDVNLMPTSEDNAQERTARFLDSLAAILITRPGGPVYAVGAAIKHGVEPSQGYMRLFLAGNDDIDSSTKDYMEKVWELLGRLSREYSSYLPEDSPLKSPEFLQETPPKGENLPRIFDNLADAIYERTRKKFKSRLTKTYTVLYAFKSVFDSHVYPHLPTDDNGTKIFGFYRTLVMIMHQITWMKDDLEGQANQKGPISRDVLLWIRDSFQCYTSFTREDWKQLNAIQLLQNETRE